MQPEAVPWGAHRYFPGSESVNEALLVAYVGEVGSGIAAVVVVTGAAVVVVVAEVIGTIVGVETMLVDWPDEECPFNTI